MPGFLLHCRMARTSSEETSGNARGNRQVTPEEEPRQNCVPGDLGFDVFSLISAGSGQRYFVYEANEQQHDNSGESLKEEFAHRFCDWETKETSRLYSWELGHLTNCQPGDLRILFFDQSSTRPQASQTQTSGAVGARAKISRLIAV